MPPLLSTETLVVLGAIGVPFLSAALILWLNDALSKQPIAQRLPFAPVLPVVLGVLFLVAFIPLWLVGGMPVLQSFLASLVVPVLVLFSCFILITIPNWIGRHLSRSKVAPRIWRWLFTYGTPFGPAMLAVMFVIFALADWFPRYLSFGISDSMTLRIIGIGIFIPTYLWQVLN
jgi:hypothetical protein